MVETIPNGRFKALCSHTKHSWPSSTIHLHLLLGSAVPVAMWIYIYIVQLENCTGIHCIRISGARAQGGLHIFSYAKHIVLWEFVGPWDKIAKFLNYCLYVKFAIPFCGSFFLWCDPLWSYVMSSGFAEKQFVKLRKNVFSAHAWTASNPRKIYVWIDLGTWNIVVPNDWKKTEALQKNTFSSSDKLLFSALGLLPTHAKSICG